MMGWNKKAKNEMGGVHIHKILEISKEMNDKW